MTRLIFGLLSFIIILSATNQAFCQELNLDKRNPVIKDSGSEDIIPYCQLWAFSDDTINIYISDKDGLFSFDSGDRKSYSSVWICRSGYETKIISSQKEMAEDDGKGNPGTALFNKTIIVFPNAIEASWIRFDISPFRIMMPYEGVFAGLGCMSSGFYDDYKNNNPPSQKDVFIGSGKPGLFSNNNFECWMHMPWFKEWKVLDRKKYHFMINAGISKAE